MQSPASLHAPIFLIFPPDVFNGSGVTGCPGVGIVHRVSDLAQLEGDLKSCPQFRQDNENGKISQLASVARPLLVANGKVNEPGCLCHLRLVVGVEEHRARLALLF